VHGLREAGLGEEAAELGSRAAAHADAYDREGVAILLGILREAAQGEQRVVPGSLAAARANLDLSDPVVVSRLQDSLRRLGAEEQVVPLAAHLPAVGMFEYFLTLSQTRGQFRFGREADGTPAAPWGWDDLS
jgi:hypothetical protein